MSIAHKKIMSIEKRELLFTKTKKTADARGGKYGETLFQTLNFSPTNTIEPPHTRRGLKIICKA